MRKLGVLALICILLTGCNLFNDTSSGNQLVESEEQNGIDYLIHSDQIEEAIHSEEKMNDLLILGRIWGFLKYYHPNVANGDFDWDNELFNILPQILHTESSKERDAVLADWIANLGTYKIDNKDKKIVNEIKLTPDLEWISNSNLEDELVAHLTNVMNAKRSGKNHYVSLKKYTGNPEFNNEQAYHMVYPDVEYRLLSLFRYWNTIEYFFPYTYLIEENWEDVLEEFIPKFIAASNEQEYNLTTLEIIARIHDTHANIWSSPSEIERYWGFKSAPFIITFVENKAVVTGYYVDVFGEESGMKVGDVITKINHQPVEEIIQEKLKYLPASNYPTQLRDLAPKLLRTNDDIIHIEYVSHGKTELSEIKTYQIGTLGVNNLNLFQIDKDYFQQLDSDIAYIYPGSMKNTDLPGIMSDIKDSKGLIIDLRCYPSDFIVYTLGEHLLPTPTEFVKLTKGSIKNPGLFTMTDTLKVGKKNKDYYNGQVIILINELTQSQAEFSAMAFRTAPNATVIGSTTAGADGDFSIVTLPGGIRTGISGTGMYYPDGTETQRIGIIPDIEVTPTIAGITENRDEVLEKAIEIINTETDSNTFENK